MSSNNQYFKNHNIKIIESNFESKKSKIAIIIPRFNYFINQNLLYGALDVLIRIGGIQSENIKIIKIPGAYEIPIIAQTLTSLCKYNGIIALGTIIQGETQHFDVLIHTIISKISYISIKSHTPISLGILTTQNTNQAIERAGVKYGNKGYEAAITILEMINIIKLIQKL